MLLGGPKYTHEEKSQVSELAGDGLTSSGPVKQERNFNKLQLFSHSCAVRARIALVSLSMRGLRSQSTPQKHNCQSLLALFKEFAGLLDEGSIQMSRVVRGSSKS